MTGQVSAASLRGDDLELRGIALAALGGSFRGEGSLRKFADFHVSGEIAGVEARRAVAQYSTAALPWNSLVSGKVTLEGMLQRKDELRAAADLVLDPAPDSAPVHGQINASYDTRTGILDLGRSSVTLPASHAEFSGALGRQLQVHVETRNPDDFLPLLGPQAASLPVKLRNGSAVFDGTVTGRLDNPQAVGHLRATNVEYSGETVNALEGDVSVSQLNVSMRHASATHGRDARRFRRRSGSAGLEGR